MNELVTSSEIGENDDRSHSAGSNAALLNIEVGNEIAIPISEESSTTSESKVDQLPAEHQISKDLRKRGEVWRLSCDHLYDAVRANYWEYVPEILERCPSLRYEEITESGDRALHLAISMKHTECAKCLIELMNPSELELQDGQGYTALCHAAMTGMVEVADMMCCKNRSLPFLRSLYRVTPLELAVSYGTAEMARLLLSYTNSNDFSEEEWFGLFLVSVHSKMVDVALGILNRHEYVAVMKGGDGRTALHILAQVDISSGWKTKDDGKMQSDLYKMVVGLWKSIRTTLKRNMVLELMKNPPILHDAAKVGNIELITIITRDYPELLSHIDDNKQSWFHVAIMYQQENMLELIKQAININTFSAISDDKSGNNLLHLAGQSHHLKGLEIVSEQDVQMQRAFAWFKAVEAIVPSFFLDMRNKDGYTPSEVFWTEHRKLLTNSQEYMKRTSESCMLISTIILTLVFAAAFAPPGGFNQFGIPILLKRNWFPCFIIFEALALFTSTYSIIGFWSIISSNYREDQFLILPHHLRHAMCALLLSVLFAISAFLSAFFLVFVGERKTLVVSFMLPLYVSLVVGVSYQLFKVLRRNYRLQYYSRMGANPNRNNLNNDSLWKRAYNFGASTLSSFCSCF